MTIYEAPHLLRVDEVADVLRLSPQTVRRMIERQELPAVRVGRSYRVNADELDAQLQPARVSRKVAV